MSLLVLQDTPPDTTWTQCGWVSPGGYNHIRGWSLLRHAQAYHTIPLLMHEFLDYVVWINFASSWTRNFAPSRSEASSTLFGWAKILCGESQNINMNVLWVSSFNVSFVIQ